MSRVVQLHRETAPFYAPTFELWLFGREAPPTVVRDIVEVKYEDALERVDGFTLTVNNWNTTTREPIYFGHYSAKATEEHPNVFEPGTELMLFLGYQGDTRLMMTGVITSVDVQFAESGHSKLIVSGLNILDRFRRQQYTWSWPDDGKLTVRDSEVAKALGGPPNETEHRPGFNIQVRIDDAALAKEPELDNIFMNNQFPILFLMERARARGYEVLLGEEEDEKSGEIVPHLYFGPTRSLRDITYDLEWGKSLVSFHPTYSSARQIFAVKVCGWDRAKKQAIMVRRTLDDLIGATPQGSKLPNVDLVPVARTANREDVITDPPARTEAEARERGDAFLASSHQGMVEATGTTIGLPDLRAGRSVNIRGTGRHFDGKYTIVSSTHLLNDSGYRTTFTARRVSAEMAA
jgi:phage protein D